MRERVLSLCFLNFPPLNIKISLIFSLLIEKRTHTLSLICDHFLAISRSFSLSPNTSCSRLGSVPILSPLCRISPPLVRTPIASFHFVFHRVCLHIDVFVSACLLIRDYTLCGNLAISILNSLFLLIDQMWRKCCRVCLFRDDICMAKN